MSKASDYYTANELENLTGTPASTFRYWASISTPDHPVGPPSFKLGRRRVWRKTTVEAWLAEQEDIK